MFILESNEVKSAMFAKGLKADTNVELKGMSTSKIVGHVHLQKIKGMQSKGLVLKLPTFKEKEINGVCGACQFGKQHRHMFPKERNVSKSLLDVVHSDVCGPT